MKTTKYICDRCKKECGDEVYSWKVWHCQRIGRVRIPSSYRWAWCRERIHVCADCFRVEPGK